MRPQVEVGLQRLRRHDDHRLLCILENELYPVPPEPLRSVHEPCAQEDRHRTAVCREYWSCGHPLLPVAVIDGEGNTTIDRFALLQTGYELLKTEKVVFFVPKGRQNLRQIAEVIAMYTAAWHAESVQHEDGGSSGY